MQILRIALLLIYFGYICCSRCISIKDCITCVSKHSWVPFIDVNCRWCPLTESCHAFGSVYYNDCPRGHSVTTTAYCYERATGVYDPENAYVYTLLSAVAYSDHPQQCMDKLLPRGGFRLVKGIGKKCDSFLFTYKECYAFVAVSDYSKLIVVAYRGTTDGSQLAHVITNTLLPKTSFKSGGKVQQYFNNAYLQLSSCATAYLKRLFLSNPNYNVVITGHSLGGAMASLMAVSLVYDNVIPANRLSLYTFGMPRVGDKRYALAFDRLVGNSWRVVHYKDIVARVPPRIAPFYDGQPYHTKTEVYYPTEIMLPASYYKVCSSNEETSCVNRFIVNPFKTATYADYHTHYFSMAVGSQCSNIGARRRRSVDGNEISAMSHLFSNETCTLVDIDDIVADIVSSSQSSLLHGHQYMVPSLVVGLSCMYTMY